MCNQHYGSNMRFKVGMSQETATLLLRQLLANHDLKSLNGKEYTLMNPTYIWIHMACAESFIKISYVENSRTDWTFFFPSFGATGPIWALAYLHETLHFTSVY
jgi:hypothetical protein